jgi:hemerythrin-like domain-containing protein
MIATEILMGEHRVIERMIANLEEGARRLESDRTIRPRFFIEATDFIKGFADGCHHKKEEGVLFPSMATYGVPIEGGPIGVMLAEHERGRLFTRNLRLAAERLEAGDQTAKQDVIANARGYAMLLRQHIMKEDNILFPMADRVLPPSEHEKVANGFDRVEHEETGEGIHEKYLALVDKLAEEVSR